jgi:hypothetical protein
MKLRSIAMARSGDKGTTVNVTVIPYDPADWNLLLERLTPELVKDTFGDLVTGDIERYALPEVRALNFVLRGAIDGGVSASLRLDPHGKSYQSIMLEAEL